jgi:hypothetical protein
MSARPAAQSAARFARARTRALRLAPLLGLLGLLAGCQNVAPSPGQGKSGPEVVAEAAPQIFGAAPSLAGEPVDVEQVLAAPKGYLQQTIKCQGTVSRVCEAAGCWLELRAAAGGAGLRVPMAGHSFFVPPSLVGKKVVVEGKLSARELSDTELAHLRREGLEATGPLFLAATTVSVSEPRDRSRSLPSQSSARSHVR